MTCLHVTCVMHMMCDMHIHDMPEHVPDRLKYKLTSMRNPIDMHLTPQLSGGIILRSAVWHMSAYKIIKQLFNSQNHSMKPNTCLSAVRGHIDFGTFACLWSAMQVHQLWN